MVVGVNKYRTDEPTEVEILDIDNTEVREKQVALLAKIRASRDASRCRAALIALEAGARGTSANIVELAVECARARATVGEISDAMERAWGRHRAQVRSVSGVYAAAYRGDPEFDALQQEIRAFADEDGRRPRILVAKLGQDGHDRGAKVIATAFADLGFDVDVGSLFQTPEEVARQAIENDVHAVGVSTQAGGHKTLVPQLVAALRAQGGGDVLVVCGGVIPPQDYGFLREHGVSNVFGPGTQVPKAAREVLRSIRERRA